MLTKIWTFVKRIQFELFLLVCVALLTFISYHLGRTAAYGPSPLSVGQDATIFHATIQGTTADALESATPAPRDLRVVVSKASDTKKYHFTWCSGAKRIKEENKVWFANETLAREAGYTLADNCQ